MRGFLYAAVALVALDLVLKAPATRLAAALATPAGWLEKWMDPHVPLITAPVPAAPSSGATGLDSGNPAAANTNQLGESKTGACPPGFPPGLKCLGA